KRRGSQLRGLDRCRSRLRLRRADASRRWPMNPLDYLIAAPLIGFLITLFLPKENKSLVKMFTLVYSLAVFAASLLLVGPTLERPAVMTSVTDSLWISTPAIRYHIGMDVVSLWLVLLSTFL